MLRNRHIHKCDSSNVCDTLEIHIELIPLKSDGGSRVEHYGEDFDEKCNLGLVKGHYFINDYTVMAPYCLENYEEVKDIKDCNETYKKHNGKSMKCNDRCIQALQVFKMLIDTGDKLIIPMELTDEVLNNLMVKLMIVKLQYNETNCRLEGYVETCKNQCEIFFDFETIASKYKHIPYLCWVCNDDTQQEFIGINTCAVDMLNALPIDKGDILQITNNSDYGCRFILGHLQC